MNQLLVAEILRSYDSKVAGLREREGIDWPDISAEEVALAKSFSPMAEKEDAGPGDINPRP